MSRGFTRVDLRDPVFFDHPLDHVPGMLLVVAGLELAEHAAMLQPDNVSFRLTFTKFCELDAPVEVQCDPRSQGKPDRVHPVWPQYREGFAGATRNPLPAELAPVPALGDGPSRVNWCTGPIPAMSRSVPSQ